MSANNISGKTAVCGIIGDPVEHTVSPAMHNAAFQHLGLDFVYVPFRVRKEDLGQAIRGVKALNIRGLNVTIPHKIAVMPFLDWIDAVPEKIGGVNTIINRDGELLGYNTDASGFRHALQAEKIKPEGEKVVILGAGGAAHAIAFILADKGANLTVINRNLGRAQDLADLISTTFSRDVKALESGRDNLKTALEGADILVNTTSVGMSPRSEATPLPADLLRPDLVIFDIIYNPLQTRLLTEAEKKGARVIGGIEMLVWQGAAAFELWTGQAAPVDIMRQASMEAVEKG
jgi:shikimate dehydrogenase